MKNCDVTHWKLLVGKTWKESIFWYCECYNIIPLFLRVYYDSTLETKYNLHVDCDVGNIARNRNLPSGGTNTIMREYKFVFNTNCISRDVSAHSDILKYINGIYLRVL